MKFPISIFVPTSKDCGFQLIARDPDQFEILCYGTTCISRAQLNRLSDNIKDLLSETESGKQLAQEEPETPAEKPAEEPKQSSRKRKKAAA